MIDRSHGLSLCRQAQLMGISRGSLYYQRKPPCKAQVQLMHRIDALHAAHPFAGSRMLRSLLKRQGQCVGRRHVRALMQRMGVRALYCQPSTSARHPQHKVYPYLLRNKPVIHSNQVWAMDITYVRMHKGWPSLCAEPHASEARCEARERDRPCFLAGDAHRQRIVLALY